MIALFICGIGVLALGTAVARMMAALRDPSTRRSTRGSCPILLDGWNLPRT
jgi:hypothetical protein